jgi:hypothetical protein
MLQGAPAAHLKDNIAAAASVPAVRAALGLELFPPEADASLAAVSRLNKKYGLVYEFESGYTLTFCRSRPYLS